MTPEIVTALKEIVADLKMIQSQPQPEMKKLGEMAVTILGLIAMLEAG